MNPQNYSLVREILGVDFISSEEVTVACGLTYTPKQIAMLAAMLPPQEILTWCHDNGFMIVAGPPHPMSLLDICALKQEYLYSEKNGTRWSDTHSKVTFACNDKVTCRWLILRKTPVPNSTSKMWNEQEQLLSDFEVVPNAAEMVWGLMVYKAVRKVWLLKDTYVRTSSIGSGGYHVDVGVFICIGLIVDLWRNDRRDGGIGIASSRKVSDP